MYNIHKGTTGVVGCGVLERETVFFIRDSEEFVPQIVTDYFKKSYQVLLEELEKMHGLSRPLTPVETKELTVLLKRVLEAKNFSEGGE